MMKYYCPKTGQAHNPQTLTCGDCVESAGPEALGKVIERVLKDTRAVPKETGDPPGEVLEGDPTPEEAPYGHYDDIDKIVDAILEALPAHVDPSTIYLISRTETFPEGSPIVVEDAEITFVKKDGVL